jgi:hypothetical protein
LKNINQCLLSYETSSNQWRSNGFFTHWIILWWDKTLATSFLQLAEQVGIVSTPMWRMLPLHPSLQIELLALHKLPMWKLRSQEEER